MYVGLFLVVLVTGVVFPTWCACVAASKCDDEYGM